MGRWSLLLYSSSEFSWSTSIINWRARKTRWLNSSSSEFLISWDFIILHSWLNCLLILLCICHTSNHIISAEWWLCLKNQVFKANWFLYPHQLDVEAVSLTLLSHVKVLNHSHGWQIFTDSKLCDRTEELKRVKLLPVYHAGQGYLCPIDTYAFIYNFYKWWPSNVPHNFLAKYNSW